MSQCGIKKMKTVMIKLENTGENSASAFSQEWFCAIIQSKCREKHETYVQPRFHIKNYGSTSQ
jgi:hypothetical protein